MKDATFHPVPEWLTKEYLETTLRKHKNDNTLTILNLDIRPATAKGENYASVMTRVRVEFSCQSSQALQVGSYIVKTTYENDPTIAAIMNSYDIYNTEMLMYEQILPKLNQMLKDIGDEDKLFARTLHVDYEHSAIIFEDLCVQQFVMADRLCGMDKAHAKLALKKVAKMHATAAVYDEKYPGTLRKLTRGIFNRHTRGFGTFFESMLKVCANYAATCPELGVYYKEKLLKLSDQVVEYATRVYDLHEGHFHTLVHGDFWVNNMMMKYGCDGLCKTNGTKALQDVLMIDFQFSCWASPAVDLHYFFNTSLVNDLRMHGQDELIQYYHQILTDTLEKLGFLGHIPTLHELHIQLEALRFYAVTSTCVVQPVMINDKTDDADFNNMIGKHERADNFRSLLYTNEKVQEYVKTLLPFFDRKGLLDIRD